MSNATPFEIFLVAPPGLESLLCAEAREKGFDGAVVTPGGVTFTGGWPEVWRANLTLRGASRVLARIGAIRVMHLAQLDKRARKFPWAEVLRPDVPIRVDVSCKASRIYHAGAATQRIETALKESLGATIAADAPLRLMARIEDDLCTFSLDTSGEPLHRRGHKEAVGKAPIRETLAALFLRQCGYSGSEPVVDPMCGSGTFVIEAAEIARGLYPGRSRTFAFEQFASFDPALWAQMRGAATPRTPDSRYFGSDRDTGAIRMSTANAERAGVQDIASFRHNAVSDLIRPEGRPGLVMVNPPYGTRIGEKKLLFAVYGALGKTLLERFKGWRVGMVTTDLGLAKAAALPFTTPLPPVSHGGLRIQLLQTEPLR
ncbi:THUMP domain-containing class I SAM-dependent RNA methyltransferase [Puniceibacterium confluentis]|uniref:THUMP domain-containing class I SAM-dependent RNA methyltransferase n=1 Tax=Puniceibacterium confluentis TaxID=1958944 RepID=UPI0011B528B9|nr:class I SAM-dependent RNA methyltransferase [Puniceibacterium confluentis]